MLDINSLKPGQMVRYSSKMHNSAESIESLWILLEEDLDPRGQRQAPRSRAFKLYQIYDSVNYVDPQHTAVTYVFSSLNAKDFTLEVA